VADSGYFNGTRFRAIDTDAATDENPLSSVLEAQIANNHQHLHRFGGGAVARAMGAQVAGNQYATNYGSHVGAEWVSVFIQPYLLTRGLKRIIVDWYGTNEWEDEYLGVDVKLELRGIAQSMVETWSELDYPSNVRRTITLELSAPYDDEVETELVLWIRGHIDADIDTSPAEYVYNWVACQEGVMFYVTTPAANAVTNNHFRAAFLYAPPVYPSGDFEYNGVQPSIILEPLFRNDNTPYPDGTSGTTAIFLLNYPASFSRIWGGEIKVGGLTSRSIAIREEHE
jgi:hypothetical protein